MLLELDFRDGVAWLTGELTIYTATAALPLFGRIAAESGPLVLDLSAVSELDTAGYQLLHLLQREATQNGRSVRVQAASPAVMDTLGVLHAHARFGLDARPAELDA